MKRARTDWAAKEHALGVLLVHGIGRQAQGETLIQAATPIYEFLRDFRGNLDRVDLIDCDLHPRRGPARVTLTFEPARPNPVGSERSWLLAESCWAESFPAASFGELLTWAIAVLPWAMLTHFGAGVRLAWQKLLSEPEWQGKLAAVVQVIGGSAMLCVAPILSVAAQVALVAAIVVSLLPIPSVRLLAQRIQQQLAFSIGDTYVLLSHPVQAAAMVSAIQRDLLWLASRCRTVAVVAHSQGAALCYIALRDKPVSGVRRFFTYGSGLQMVGGLERAGEREAIELKVGWASIVTTVAAVLGLWILFQPAPTVWLKAAIVTAAAASLVVVVSAGTVVLTMSFPYRQYVAAGISVFVLSLLTAAVAWDPALRQSGRWAVILALAVMAGITLCFAGLEAFKGAEPLLRKVLLAATAVLGPLLMVSILGWARPSLTFWEAVLTVGTAVLLLVFVAAMAVRAPDIAGLPNTVGAFRKGKIEWTDWFASHDPVAQGPIAALGNDSIEVHNRRSIWSDHTTYWQNPDQFVQSLVRQLFGCTGWNQDNTPDWSDTDKVAARRRWRVRLLAMTRAMMIGGLFVSCVLRWPELPSIGTQVISFVSGVEAKIPEAGAAEVGRMTAALGAGPARTGVGFAALSSILLMVYSGLFAVWRRWDRQETRRIQDGNSFVQDPGSPYVWAVSLMGAVVITVATPHWAAVGESTVLWFAAAALAGTAIRMLKVAPDAPATEREARRQKGPAQSVPQ